MRLRFLRPEARTRAERNHGILVPLHRSVVVAVRLHGHNGQRPVCLSHTVQTNKATRGAGVLTLGLPEVSCRYWTKVGIKKSLRSCRK